jgi:hypothetical protein
LLAEELITKGLVLLVILSVFWKYLGFFFTIQTS